MSNFASRRFACLLACVAGCAEEPVDGLPCPCGSGYVCCSDNVCVPEGDACAVHDQTPSPMANSPCSAVESNNLVSHGELDWTYLYDGAGNFVRGDATSPDGTSQAHDQNSYDAHDRLTSQTDSVNGTVIESEMLTYDALGRLTELVTTSAQTPPLSDVWSYSGLDATERWSSSNNLLMTSQYVEDQAGNKVSGTFTTPQDGDGTWTFVYDADGRLTSEQADFADGTTFEGVTWAYNAAGQLLSYAQTVGGSAFTTMQMTYDTQGRQATLTVTAAGSTDVLTAHYCQ